ncbi:hypothetical protein ElyMa_000431200 [Elysia marginata]|uniref:Uncharacterized protein n=1 Tax=Elysia marginata TaxID=1093978 RepID=A0AAV4FN68_9GAST|nr:hypothetical protein ElyMa_000431200 [Elysia marginata]
MAGCILQLVDPAIILTDPELRAEKINFTDLNLAIVDNLDMLQWAARRKLLRNTVLCATCNQPVSLNRYAQGVDGYRWRCNAHKFTMSVRNASFFESSHLPLRKILKLMYLWCHDLPQNYIMFELVMGPDSRHTVVDWSNFMRDICQEDLL